MKKTTLLPVMLVFLTAVLAACGGPVTPTAFKDSYDEVDVPDEKLQVAPIDGMEKVYVPEGELQMGSDYGDEDEKPVHMVDMDAYWIDRTEVTNAMFADFVDDSGYITAAEQADSSRVYDSENDAWEIMEGADWMHPRGASSSIDGLEDHPVVHVTWDDARAYCEWAGRRLPTEAEWEKTSRGPGGSTYPWGEYIDCSIANYWQGDESCAGDMFTAPVGSYPQGASVYGAFDMAGNVWEWVSDWYAEDYYSESPDEDPQGPSTGETRVIKGGSWSIDPGNLRGAVRHGEPPTTFEPFIGFRCAESP